MLFQANLFQYLFILSFICARIILQRDQKSFMKKYDSEYMIMRDHYEVSKYVKRVIQLCKINTYSIQNVYMYQEFQKEWMEKMEYVYFFRSKNLLVYFFKKKADPSHKIYFEGVDEMGDLQYLSFPNKWFNEYTLKSIRKNLSENGFLFKIYTDGTPRVLRIRNQIHNIFKAFSYMNENEYFGDKKICMEGYSMGGVLSQVFTYILLQNHYIQKEKLQIKLYIIESWWGGSKEFYEYLSSFIEIKNVMCMGSILYYYNRIFQHYFSIDSYIHFRVKPLFQKYIQLPFPLGITEYFGDHHYISRFIQYVKR